MKKILLIILAIAFTVSSCEDYDSEFLALNKSIAELQAQVNGFSTLQASLTTLTTSVATLQTAVNALPKTQVDITGLQASLTAQAALINTLQTNLNTVIATYATSANLATAQASITALAAQLAAAQADLDELLAANNVYDGNLAITNAAQLAFAVGLDDNIMIVNGSLTIDTDGLDQAAVAAVTSKILNVTGGVSVDNTTDGKIVDLSKLTAIGGGVTVTGKADVKFTALTSVTGAYSVTGFDISDAALKTVGGIVTLNYDGGYNQPNLTSAASLALTDVPTSTVAPITTGTLTVDFSGLTVTTPGTITFGVATSVKLKNAFNNVTANAANTVDFLAANNSTALTVSATKAASVVTIAGTLLNGTTGQELSVTGSATSVLKADALTKTANLTVTGIATAVSFPALTTAAVVAAPAAVSFSAPLLVATSVDATAAKTVSLTNATLTAPAVETLTFAALAYDYTAPATLKTATITGKVGATNSFTSTSAVLATASFAGELDAVSLTAAAKLASLTTVGAIDSFTLSGATILTAASFGHGHIVGNNGSTMVITNNPKLASLTTSTNFLNTLVVTGNAELATMNFASYVNVPVITTNTVTIHTNKLSGTFTPAVAATATTPYVEAKITNASLMTLKPWISAFKAANGGNAFVDDKAKLIMNVDVDDVDAVTAGNQLLSTAMIANAPVSTVIDATVGIDLVAEFLLIQ